MSREVVCSMRRLTLFVVLLCSLHATVAAAHHAVREPSLGELVLKQEIAVRGTIRVATENGGGYRIAVLGVEKVLKGDVAGEEVRFASDPDHGVRYAAGERVLVFLSRTTASAAARRAASYVSPQVFSMKYPITSFDPSGYDRLIAGLLAVPPPPARLAALKQVLVTGLASHERKVRLYAAEALRAVAASGRGLDEADRRQLLAYTSDAKCDPEVREALRDNTLR